MNDSTMTKVTCPVCGTGFKIAERTHEACGTVIGKDSNLGEIHPQLASEPKPLPNKAQERIEALKAAGVDVSGLFAMIGANGSESVVRCFGGQLTAVDDNDPIYNAIRNGGDIPNRKLFRRWVMAQMFSMLRHESEGGSWFMTELKWRGYDYQWKMLENEMRAQYVMHRHGDFTNFHDRNRWFDKALVMAMMDEYMALLAKHIRRLEIRKCKGVPYKKIGRKLIFLSDIDNKVFKPLDRAIKELKIAHTPAEVYGALAAFNRCRVKLPFDTPQHKDWVDSFKGSGAYFTLQNMIRFHGCFLQGEDGKPLGKEESLQYLGRYAEECSDSEGYKLLGMLRRALKYNNIDIPEKFAGWHKKHNG